MTEPPPIPDEAPTRELPVVPYEPTAVMDSTPDPEGLDPLLDDQADDEWPIRGPARGIRLSVVAGALLALLLVGGGFWAGATVQKSHGSSSAGAGAANRLRAAAAAGAFGGAGAAAATDSTAGTVSVVDGNVLYVITGDGALVKVTLLPSATISRNDDVKANELRPGDAVVVTGSADGSGTVTASAVAATASGVTASSGFGRGLGGGAGNFGGGSADGATGGSG